MASRQNFYAEAAGPVTTTSSTFSDLTTLTFTPDNGVDYVVFWSLQQSNNSSTADGQARLYNDTTATQLVLQNWEAHETSTPIDKRSLGGMYKFTGAGASVTLKIQAASESTNSVVSTLGRILVIAFGSNDKYAESTARVTTTSTTFSIKCTLTFTPGSQGDYILFSSANQDTAAADFSDIGLFLDGTATLGLNTGNYDEPGSKDTTNRYPWVKAYKAASLSAASHDFTIQFKAGTAGVTNGIGEMRILALRVSDLEAVYEAQVDGPSRSSGTESTYQTATSLTQTTANVAHAIIAAGEYANLTNNTVSAFMNLDEGGSSLSESSTEPNVSVDAFTHWLVVKETLSAASHTWTLQRRSETGSATTVAAVGAIVVIQLDSASGDQSLTPSLFTNSQTFYSPTVSSTYGLTPSLFTNSQTFYAPTALAISPLAPSLFTNSQTFYSATVTPGSVDLSPSLFTNGQTFYSATVGSTYGLTPDLFTNSQTFPAATVAPGAVDLAPSLFTNSQTFYQPTVAGGDVSVEPPLFTNGQTFYSPNVSATVDLQPGLFTNAQVFYPATVSEGSPPVTGAPEPGFLANMARMMVRHG